MPQFKKTDRCVWFTVHDSPDMQDQEPSVPAITYFCFSLVVLVCVCECVVYMYVHVGGHSHICVCMRWPEVDIRILLLMEFTISAGWPVSKPLGSSCLYFIAPGFITCCCHTWRFMWVLGSKLKSFANWDMSSPFHLLKSLLSLWLPWSMWYGMKYDY